jgi:hypothetical protein
MNIEKKFLVLITVLSMAGVYGCKDNASDPGTTDTFPESNLSYTQHIQPIFNTYCAIIDCHDSYTRTSNLGLSSYYDATARPGIIVANKANASVLVQRIEGSIQPQMPPNRAPLSTNKIKAIRTWINEGAKNN